MPDVYLISLHLVHFKSQNAQKKFEPVFYLKCTLNLSKWLNDWIVNLYRERTCLFLNWLKSMTSWENKLEIFRINKYKVNTIIVTQIVYKTVSFSFYIQGQNVIYVNNKANACLFSNYNLYNVQVYILTIMLLTWLIGQLVIFSFSSV